MRRRTTIEIIAILAAVIGLVIIGIRIQKIERNSQYMNKIHIEP